MCIRDSIDTQLRIHDEDGLNIVTERNVVFSSIVMSREAQTAILEQQDMGEVVLAGELSSLECSRPWVRIAALATFFGTAWIYLFPLQYKLALVDIYGMMPLVTELLLPFFLFFMGTGLFKLSKSSFRISYVKTIKEYPILPSLAKQIVFEKLTFTEEAIKKRIQFFNRHIAFTSDYWGKLCAIIFIGGISVILIFGTIINMFNEYGLQVPFELTLWLLAAMFAIVLAFALPAFKYDL